MPDREPEERTLGAVIVASAIYAVSAMAQRAIGLLLIPVYTRVIEPREFGMLEVLNAAAAVAFSLLSFGLPSAINKCFHRDCSTEGERRAVLPTALILALPVLLVGAAIVTCLASPIARVVTGTTAAVSLVPLVVASGFGSSAANLALSALRAQERASAFAILSSVQFVVGLVLTITLVVGLGWGVHGVLWGAIVASAVTAPLALVVAGGWGRPSARLVRPLLGFGTLLLPVLLAGWVMDASDRYVLRLFRGLDDVALYGIGYRFGMLVEMLVVWPFQLAWPAFAFAASHRPDHRRTYARALTYLTAVLVLVVLVVAIMAREVVPLLVGEVYAGAWTVVPIVALSYACNGIQYCVSPGVHLAGRSVVLTALAVVAAIVNLAANFVLIPHLGSLGAAWSTFIAFAVLALGTLITAQRLYPVPYEYGRLGKILGSGITAFLVVRMVGPTGLAGAALATAVAAGAFVGILWAGGFLETDERKALATALAHPKRWLAATWRVP